MKNGLSKALITDCIDQAEPTGSSDGPSVLIVRDEQGQPYSVKTWPKSKAVAFVYKTDRKHVIPYRVFFLRRWRNS